MTRRSFKKNLQRTRHLSQTAFFALFVLVVVGSVCSFTFGGVSVTEPLGALQILIPSGALVPQTILATLVVTTLVFVIAVILLGRAWCAWACPIGSISELTDSVMARRRFKAYVDRKRPRGTEGLVQKAIRNRENKYAVLGGVLASSALTKSPAWCTFCPIGTVCRGTVAGGFVAGAEMLIVGAVVAASAYEKRFFCKYLCPVAGLLTAISRLNFFVKPKVSHKTCRKCTACNHMCPEGLNVYEEKTFAECTKCFVCYSKCPYNTITISLGPS